MTLLSCGNCCYNGLQYGSIGLSVGYCTEHRTLLRQSDLTTCGRQFRKDLLLEDAETEQQLHMQRFDSKQVVDLQNQPLTNGSSHFIDTHVKQLASDRVGRVVTEYGQLGTKIQTLSQLRVLPRGRAELARLSLGRVYVRRCVSNQGQWTSGIHLFWWTASTLSKKPRLSVGDFRAQLDMDLKRQHELAQWSIVMLRLTFLADIGGHVERGLPLASSPVIRRVGERLAALISLVDDAAEEASTDLDALMHWIEAVGERRIKEAMSETEYQDISRDLHQD